MRRKLLTAVALGGGAALLLASPAGAQEAYEPTTQDILDNIWVFIAGILVLFMQAGFALVEAGLTRAKNVANIMMKNLMDCMAGTLAFFVVGYSIAYGGDGRRSSAREASSWATQGPTRAVSPRAPTSSSRSCSPPPRRRSSRAPWPSGRSSRATSSTASGSPR